jgi:hypothetical protein
MASFVWMLLTEPSYKPNTLMARSLAGEESKPEDLPDGTSSEAGWLVRRAGNSVLTGALRARLEQALLGVEVRLLVLERVGAASLLDRSPTS